MAIRENYLLASRLSASGEKLTGSVASDRERWILFSLVIVSSRASAWVRNIVCRVLTRRYGVHTYQGIA